MSETVPTVLIKSDAPDNEQGCVRINESDFDPKIHELFIEGGEAAGGGSMKVADIKAALVAKGVEIPEGAKKPELLALLAASNG